MSVGVIDYKRMATVTWTSDPAWLAAQGKPVEEYCDDLTLKQAVTFVIDHLDTKCRQSVIVRCGVEKYNLLDIEAMYQALNLRAR